MTVLLRTIHGSTLYGMNHAGSDQDWYEVHTNKPRARAKYARQTINGKQDVTVVDLSTFMMFCYQGVPQALEALFSNVAEIDTMHDFRSAYRPNTAGVVGKYKQTIKSFSYGEFKQRRHALRLIINLEELLTTGRFSPTLTEDQVETITRLATSPYYYMLVESYLKE